MNLVYNSTTNRNCCLIMSIEFPWSRLLTVIKTARKEGANMNWSIASFLAADSTPTEGPTTWKRIIRFTTLYTILYGKYNRGRLIKFVRLPRAVYYCILLLIILLQGHPLDTCVLLTPWEYNSGDPRWAGRWGYTRKEELFTFSGIWHLPSQGLRSRSLQLDLSLTHQWLSSWQS